MTSSPPEVELVDRRCETYVVALPRADAGPELDERTSRELRLIARLRTRSFPFRLPEMVGAFPDEDRLALVRRFVRGVELELRCGGQRVKPWAILIAGDTAGGYGQGIASTDAYLSVATPAGISRTRYVTGPENQRITALAATPDGSAWINVANFRHEDPPPDPVIQVGDRTFPEMGSYLFKIVP